MQRIVPTENTRLHHYPVSVFHDGHHRHTQSWVARCIPYAAGHTADNVHAVDDGRDTAVEGTEKNKAAEDKGFLVDTARSQLRQFAVERSGCMAAERVDSSLWL